MSEAETDIANWRFGAFEVDGRTAELRRNGVAIKLQEQPAQLLLYLLRHSGQIISRQDLHQHLWPAGTYVDFDHALNTAVMKLREALGDRSLQPLYIQTIPRKGYRFVAPVSRLGQTPETNQQSPGAPEPSRASAVLDVAEEVAPLETRPLASQSLENAEAETSVIRDERSHSAHKLYWGLAAILVAVVVIVAYKFKPPHAVARSLTRITFDEGLQTDPTWSPDGRYIAYSSDRGGNTDIWVQQINVGDPIRITEGPGSNWQPSWSPDGKYIAYRSDVGEGGIFIIPALGGIGERRLISPFGWKPRWSPLGNEILFQESPGGWKGVNSFFLAGLNGDPPRKLFADFLNRVGGTAFGLLAASWHPDGKRITLWVDDPARSTMAPTLWTISLDGGDPVRTDIAPGVEKEFAKIAIEGETEWVDDNNFTWSPAGDAIYLEMTFRGAKNIWKFSIDPHSLRATAIERLTTGGGRDMAPAISPDGRKLAFTAASGRISAWHYPFAANQGRTTGEGEPITSSGFDAWRTALTRDGTRLVFSAVRAGEGRLSTKSLPNGREIPIFSDAFDRFTAVWSPDASRLVYTRARKGSSESQLMLYSVDKQEESPLTALSRKLRWVCDWSEDGKSILYTEGDVVGKLRYLQFEPTGEITNVAAWEAPVDASPQADLRAHRLIADPQFEIYQEHYSPDGRWIIFEAVKTDKKAPDALGSSDIYVIRRSGGTWIPIVKAGDWADKPQWSPDGKTIYFILGKGSFFNIWATRFDPSVGVAQGQLFQVTSLNSPSLMVPGHMGTVEISVRNKDLVLTLAQVSGGIWILDEANH